MTGQGSQTVKSVPGKYYGKRFVWSSLCLILCVALVVSVVALYFAGLIGDYVLLLLLLLFPALHFIILARRKR